MIYIPILIFLIFLPFQPFLVTWLGSPFISILRDLFVVFFFVSALSIRLKQKRPIVGDEIDFAIFIFSLWFLISYLFISHNLTSFSYSIRYSLFPWLTLWSLKTFTFSEKQKKTILKISLAVFLVIAVIGFIHAYLLPRDFFLQFGYAPDIAVGNGIWITSAKLPAIQLIPGNIARLQSTLSGPVQFGVYTLIFLGIIMALFRQKKHNPYLYSLLIIAILTLILTFTRSSWLGFILMTVIFFFTTLKKIFLQKLVIFLILLAGLFMIALPIPTIRTIINSSILRPNSSIEHQASIMRIWKEKQEIGFWGRGVGLSGPASFRLTDSEKRAVENSYLRTYEELGISGLILFIYLLSVLLDRTFKKFKDASATQQIFKLGSGLGLLGIMIASLFTDSFTEAIPILTLTLFIALGLPNNQKEGNKERLTIFSIPLDLLTKKSVLELINKSVKSNHKLQIATVNAEFLIESLKNKPFRETLKQTDLNTIDGIGVIAAIEYQSYQLLPALRKYKFLSPFYLLLSTCYFLLLGILTGIRLLVAPQSFEKVPERVTGSDLVRTLCLNSRKTKQSLFFLGDVKSGQNLDERLKEKFPGLKIAGTESGGQISLDGIPKDQNLIKRLKAQDGDIIFVGFGSPKQELFIHKYQSQLSFPICIGIGGSIDFLVGEQNRAPLILQKISLEWLWRLITQPKRYKRIFNAVIKFPWSVFREKIKI